MDVIFILLIFFMMNDQLDRQQGLQLKLPEAQQSQPVIEAHLSIEINALNQISVDERMISFPELQSWLTEKDRNTKVLIKGDQDASYGKTLKIFDLLGSLGFERVTLGTIPPRL
jgi:biopolymer transport protein ExbD